MQKPTILITNRKYPQFSSLNKKYTLLWYPVNTHTSLFEQAEIILSDIKQKKLVIDGVMGLFTDAPPIVAAIIAEKLNLPGPSLKSIHNAQNKGLFAQIAAQGNLPIPQTTAFSIMDPNLPNVPFPLFIKPVKGSFSSGSYILYSDQDFKEKIAYLQKNSSVQACYDSFFNHFSTSPLTVRDWYVAQEYINAKQYTLDGFVFQSKTHVIGITQTIYSPNRKSFKRFDFPSALNKKIREEVTAYTEKMIRLLDFNNSAFSVEFFLTKEGKIIFIECNTRLTYQFIPLYNEYYTHSPFEMSMLIALGQMPDMRKKKQTRHASSFPLRVWTDQKVTHVPTMQEVKQFAAHHDLLTFQVDVKAGTRLSEYRQDAYSFRYGVIDIAGRNLTEIQQKFKKISRKIPIKLTKITS